VGVFAILAVLFVVIGLVVWRRMVRKPARHAQEGDPA
jgi:hypothetical protein